MPCRPNAIMLSTNLFAEPAMPCRPNAIMLSTNLFAEEYSSASAGTAAPTNHMSAPYRGRIGLTERYIWLYYSIPECDASEVASTPMYVCRSEGVDRRNNVIECSQCRTARPVPTSRWSSTEGESWKDLHIRVSSPTHR
jgi:hypothetical protein